MLHGALLALVALSLLAPAANAADPGRWKETGRSTIPLYYYQGVASDPQANLFFNGVYFGLYRTDRDLNETARNDDVIPPAVSLAEQYNHIGDIAWDAGEGGRILLPLECYYPNAPGGNNTCQNGAIGVADPQTLQWRYYVKLDPAFIKKAMWVAVSPDGRNFWTQQGNDLLVYNMAELTAASAAPLGPKLKPIRILKGAVPPSGITGAVFFDGRLFAAGGDRNPFQVWSIDPADGSRQLEIERPITGESEGLDVFNALGGVLHWQIQPYNTSGPPSYGVSNGTLLHFKPVAAGEPAPPPPAPCCTPGQEGAAPAGAAPSGTTPGVEAPASSPGASIPGGNVNLTGCLNTRGGALGKRLGPAHLGRSRGEQRKAIGGQLLRSGGGIDRYCATGGGALRIGYPTRRLNRGLKRSERRRIRSRAVLVLTSSKRFSVRGIKPGTSVRTLRRRLRGERRVRVGRSVWYLAPGKRVRLVFKARGKRVAEVGIGDKRLTRTTRADRHFLRAWERGG